MPDRNDAEDLASTFRALPVFHTLRTNLALFSSFARRSVIEPANYSGEDLGFLGIEPGESQLKAHNQAIATILGAVVTQALRNYCELKRIKPRLEDPDLEKFLDQFGDRERFVRGMTKARNAVFHVKSRKAWRDRDIAFVHEIVQQRIQAGDPDVVARLSFLLYDFTQKCFTGSLKIWPLRLYEELDALDPELRARMGTGEASLDEFIEALGRNRVV